MHDDLSNALVYWRRVPLHRTFASWDQWEFAQPACPLLSPHQTFGSKVQHCTPNGAWPSHSVNDGCLSVAEPHQRPANAIDRQSCGAFALKFDDWRRYSTTLYFGQDALQHIVAE